MRVEDHNALRFILQDEIYLLDEDKKAPDADPIPQPEIQTQQPEFNYLGSNKKHFLILVSYDQHEFMQDDHLTALESVLSRLGYSRQDVAIVNQAKQDDADFEHIAAYFKPQIMLILGGGAVPKGVKLKLNLVEDVSSIKTLLTFGFDEMMKNVDNKKAFWEQMKNL